MKKKIAFLMASVMTMTMMPTINSYANSDNTLSNGNVTVSEKTLFYEPGSAAPAPNTDNQSKVKYTTVGQYLNVELKENVTTNASLELRLDDGNSKFAFRDAADYVVGGVANSVIDTTKGTLTVVGTGSSRVATYVRNDDTGAYPTQYTLTNSSEDTATVVFDHPYASGTKVQIPLIARMSESLSSGSAKLRVEGEMGGAISSSTHTFATINKGSTVAKVEDLQTGKNRIEIKKLTVTENAVGTMKAAPGDGFYLELPSGYSFSGAPVLSYENLVASDSYNFTSNNRKVEFKFSSFAHTGKFAGKIIITGLTIVPNSSSDTITKEDVKISIDNLGDSDMVTSQEFTAGTHADYSMTFKTEGTVPTLLNGYYDSSSKTNDRAKSVKVVVAEETAGSLINGGDLVLTLSDSAKIVAVKIEDKENITQNINGTYYLNQPYANVEVKDSKVTLRGIGNSSTSSDKAKFTVSFYLSLESGFVGDVTMKVSGDAIRNNTSIEPVVIAKSVNPLNVTVNTVYFAPGQTVEMGDIVLTEQMNSNGESSLEEGKTLTLGFSNNNNYLSVVGTPTVKTENGLTVKDVKVTNTTASGSALSFRIDDASSKNKASKITISGLKVAASASTPEGTYELLAAGTAVGGNSTSIIGSNSDVASFSTDGMTIAKLQYGGKVAMKITIGDKMVNVNGQNVEMKLAPFIDAKTGTTYMQVSDIVKATGKTCTFFDNRIQKVEGMDKTLFVTFGDRTFEKDKSIVKIAGQTIPETMTNEQGQAVNMIIKDDYTCLPLRYFVEKVLGQKINWNGTDNTITVE